MFIWLLTLATDATSSDTDITSRFDLDDGQRDNFYDIGRIKLKDGEVTPTGRLLINFDCYTHSTGDYFVLTHIQQLITKIYHLILHKQLV